MGACQSTELVGERVNPTLLTRGLDASVGELQATKCAVDAAGEVEATKCAVSDVTQLEQAPVVEQLEEGARCDALAAAPVAEVHEPLEQAAEPMCGDAPVVQEKLEVEVAAVPAAADSPEELLSEAAADAAETDAAGAAVPPAAALEIASVALPADGVSERDDVTFFRVEVTPGGGSEPWVVTKRYSQFRQLHESLSEEAESQAFPRKHMRSVKGERLSQRREGLEAWLKSVVGEQQEGKATVAAAELRQFLESDQTFEC